MAPQKTVLLIGGTGAQGLVVVQALTKDSAYAVRILTRDAQSSFAQSIANLPNVTLIQGDAYSEPDLLKAFQGVQLAYVNVNGFAIGEKAEIYWGIRSYEIARQVGTVEHFIWGGLDYLSKLGDFDPKFRCGHYDGKGKVTEYLLAQPRSPMAISILTTGPYMEMLSEFLKPRVEAINGVDTYVFTAPLGTHGRVPFIHLEDIGSYARWLFDNRDRATGLNLKVATAHVGYDGLAKVFTAVTGKPALYRSVTLDGFFDRVTVWNPDQKVGLDPKDNTLMTFRANFSGFWNGFAANIIQRDYALLDEVLPSRVKSVEEWMRKVGYTGEVKSILKDIEDRGNKTAL